MAHVVADQVHKKILYDLNKIYADELTELLIQKDRSDGKMDDKMEQELRNRLKRKVYCNKDE